MVDKQKQEEVQKALKELYNKLPPTGKSIANGAIAGAAVGSVVPVIGTGIGALVGGAAGLAYKIRQKLKDND